VPMNPGELADWRREAAKTAFNRTWELIDQPVRSQQDEMAMLLAAFGSRYLWDEVGDDDQFLVGDWQFAHVASLLGDGRLAKRFAASALERAETNGWTNSRLVSTLEGMARASAVSGDDDARDEFAARCHAVLETIEDVEDRELVASEWATVPGRS
jgi:hypothetical protein